MECDPEIISSHHPKFCHVRPKKKKVVKPKIFDDWMIQWILIFMSYDMIFNYMTNDMTYYIKWYWMLFGNYWMFTCFLSELFWKSKKKDRRSVQSINLLEVGQDTWLSDTPLPAHSDKLPLTLPWRRSVAPIRCDDATARTRLRRLRWTKLRGKVGGRFVTPNFSRGISGNKYVLWYVWL